MVVYTIQASLDDDDFIEKDDDEDDVEEEEEEEEAVAGPSSGGPVYLDCPFHDKDACKAKGGKWDPVVKKWYVPPGKDTGEFQRWLPRQSSTSPHGSGRSRQSPAAARPSPLGSGGSASRPRRLSSSVLYKYRRHLQEEEEKEEEEEDDPELNDDIEEENDEEGDSEDEEEEGEEDDEEEDADDGGGLLCVRCNERRHPDNFSDRQRRDGTDTDRYCLLHTGTGGFGNSYKRPRPVESSGSEAEEDRGGDDSG